MNPPPALDQATWHSCNNGTCVEVALADGQVWVRDSKDPAGGVLPFSLEEWHTFLEGVKNGRFDPARLTP